MTERQVKDTEPWRKERVWNTSKQQTDNSYRHGTMKVKVKDSLEHHPFLNHHCPFPLYCHLSTSSPSSSSFSWMKVPFRLPQTLIYWSGVFPKFHVFACTGWLTVSFDVFQKVKTRLTFQLGSQKKQLPLPSFLTRSWHKILHRRWKNNVNRFKCCLVLNDSANKLFCGCTFLQPGRQKNGPWNEKYFHILEYNLSLFKPVV